MLFFIALTYRFVRAVERIAIVMSRWNRKLRVPLDMTRIHSYVPMEAVAFGRLDLRDDQDEEDDDEEEEQGEDKNEEDDEDDQDEGYSE